MIIRIPWKIRLLIRYLRNATAYYLNKTHYFFKKKDIRPVICFYCHFHGTTGATIAIAQIANLLAERYRVKFVTSPQSDFNSMLNPAVEIIDELPSVTDLIICDGNTPLEEIRSLRFKGSRIMITSHGILQKGLRLDKIKAATATHFVSGLQLMHHTLDEGRYFVIPNCCNQVSKTNRTYNVGIVGRVKDSKKNVKAAIDSALLSSAAYIHVWGDSASDLVDDDRRIIFHDWESNKKKIYNSFDILISLSLEESFGLTVIEAMSAGIPCVLSDIPAFQAFSDCPGIAIVDRRDKSIIAEKIDDLLSNKDVLSPKLVEYWHKNYSCSAISALWYSNAKRLIGHF